MKLFLSILVIIGAVSTHAQNVIASRSADLQNSPDYDLVGTAFIEELDDGTFQFRLSDDYATDSGPDVQLLLTNNAAFSSPIETDQTQLIVDAGTGSGGISHFSGALTQNLGNSISSLSDFDHVVFVCVAFGDLYWGHGTFGEITVSCENLTIDTSISQDNPTLQANAENLEYQWIDCNNGDSPIEDEISQDFTPEISGNYAVVITDGACSATSECISIMIVGVDEEELEDLVSIYPNPTSENLTIDLPHNHTSSIKITNPLGKVISHESYTDVSSVQLNLNGETGLYFVEISSNDRVGVFKVLKN